MISTHRIMPASHTRKWWLAGGIHPSQVVAAYQPKGAVDLAASYVNLANPGTDDAQVGEAPTLDSSGWVFNGTTQYLIGPLSNNAGLAVRFSDVTNTGAVIGARNAINVNQIYFRPNDGDNSRVYSNSLSENLVFVATSVSSGVLIINNNNGALNGIIEASSLLGNVSQFYNYYIGAVNNNSVLRLQCGVKTQACCFFASGTTLTAAQIAAISAAMAAL